jgi:hypothetical protein
MEPGADSRGRPRSPMADIERWSKPASYHADWLERAKIIARHLHGCASVLDLGAGTQMLRPLLPGVRYVPVDVVSLGPDTIRVDFDRPWDAGMLPQADGVAIAGLLEHIADPLGTIARLRGIGRVWAVSYMDSRRHRHALVPLEALEQAFSDAGMRVDKVTQWRGQNVYRLERA